MSNYRYEVRTTPCLNGDVVQEIDFVKPDGAVAQLMRQVIRTQDEQIRQALIDLGWTPPGARS